MLGQGPHRLDVGHHLVGSLGRVGQVLAHIDPDLDAPAPGLFEDPGGAMDVALDRPDLVEVDAEGLQEVQLPAKLRLGVAAAAAAVDPEGLALRSAQHLVGGKAQGLGLGVDQGDLEGGW